MNRIVIAGTQSGVGKTTIAIGLMAALVNKGYKVQPFKVGPDYIDPGFHSLVTGIKSRNLDSYFLGEDGVKEVFLNSAEKADISIIEGVMGLFDGKGKKGISSTAQIAKILNAPVILVIDAKKLAQSGAAIAYGYKNYDPELNVKGIILNNIASQGHYQMIKTPIEEKVGIKVIGYLPKNIQLELPERHLGLVPTQESKKLKYFFKEISKEISSYIDLEQVLNISKNSNQTVSLSEKKIYKQGIKCNVDIGVAYDQAFNFYYQDSLDILEKQGVNIKYFSPLKDNRLPEVDGLYIGGGFPESFLEDLAANKSMKIDIYNKIKVGLPTYAECGGLMYLTRQITNFDSQEFPMVGIIPACTMMEKKLQAMGYVEVKAIQDNLLLKKGQQARGHEFHYSRLVNLKADNFTYQVSGGKGVSGRLAGYQYKNLLASYIHLHFGNNPDLAKNFLNSCLHYKMNLM